MEKVINKPMEVQFREWKCKLVFRQYFNKRTAIELIEIGTNEPIAVATVNLPDIDLKQDEVAIKNYSENEGMLNVLITTGIVSTPIDLVHSGYVEIPICRLLIKPE